MSGAQDLEASLLSNEVIQVFTLLLSFPDK